MLVNLELGDIRNVGVEPEPDAQFLTAVMEGIQ
jgi:hypothetical protein